MAQNCECDCHPHDGSHGRHAPGSLVGRLSNSILQGWSAYQVACIEGGYEGSVTEWLQSLVGRGIVSIRKTSETEERANFTVWYSDDTQESFYITLPRDGIDGISITGVEKTGSDGLVDHYQINYSNGVTTAYDITNGADGSTFVSLDLIEDIDNVKTYQFNFSDGSSARFSVTDGSDGHDIEMQNASGILQYRKIAKDGEEQEDWRNLANINVLIQRQLNEILPSAIDDAMQNYNFIRFVDELPENPDSRFMYVLREEVEP